MPGLIVAASRRVPAPIARALGRLPLVDRLARAVFTGATVVIPRGAAAGMRFDATGQAPGFALGTWEPEVQETVAGLLQPGQVVYDIGASSGFYTLIAARAIGPAGVVVAFEPLPSSAVDLRKNIVLNGLENVIVLELAIGDSPGRAVLVEAGLQAAVAVAAAGVAVDVVTLDDLVAGERVPPPDLIKMDVEGAELAVLRGATRTLHAHRPVLLVEVHDGGDWRVLAGLLAEHGYSWHGVESAEPQFSTEPVHILAHAG